MRLIAIIFILSSSNLISQEIKRVVSDRSSISYSGKHFLHKWSAENKNISQVGIRFMKFCAKYDLNKISEQAQLYVEPFNARLT